MLRCGSIFSSNPFVPNSKWRQPSNRYPSGTGLGSDRGPCCGERGHNYYSFAGTLSVPRVRLGKGLVFDSLVQKIGSEVFI